MNTFYQRKASDYHELYCPNIALNSITVKRFIKLYYIPGAAGNFLSRCINLLDDTYVWCNGKSIPKSLDEKFDLLTYKKVDDRNKWIEFEDKILSYDHIQPHWDIGPNSNAVELMHPTNENFHNITTIGKDDKLVKIYIDCTDHLDWVIINGWAKHGMITHFTWSLMASKIEKDPSVYKVKLSNIVNGYEKFLLEFKALATMIDRILTPDIEIFLHKLYDEWTETTVRNNDLKRTRSDYASIFKRISEDFEKNL